MIESTETYVLMKCTKCGYQEKVPEWVLEELEFDKKMTAIEWPAHVVIA